MLAYIHSPDPLAPNASTIDEKPHFEIHHLDAYRGWVTVGDWQYTEDFSKGVDLYRPSGKGPHAVILVHEDGSEEKVSISTSTGRSDHPSYQNNI